MPAKLVDSAPEPLAQSNISSFTSATIYLCKVCIAASLVVALVVVSPSRNAIRLLTALAPETQSIVADPSMKSIGTVYGGQKMQLAFALRNRSRATVRIAGSTTNCGCIVLEDLPFTIKPGEEKHLNVWVVAPDPKPTRQEFDQTVTLFTNSPGQATLTLRITGTVKEHGGHAEGGERERES